MFNARQYKTIVYKNVRIYFLPQTHNLTSFIIFKMWAQIKASKIDVQRVDIFLAPLPAIKKIFVGTLPPN